MFRNLTLEERGLLLNFMFWYCFEESEPSEEDLENAGWKVKNTWEELKPEMDEQFEKWDETCEKYQNDKEECTN